MALQAHMPSVFADGTSAALAAVRTHTPVAVPFWWTPENVEAAHAPEDKIMLGRRLQKMLKEVVKNRK